MLLLYIIAVVKSYYISTPRHTLMIATKSSGSSHVDTFPFSQFGPFKSSFEPIIIARAIKTSTTTPEVSLSSSTSDETSKIKKEKTEEKKEEISNSGYSTLCKHAIYGGILGLVFVLGYYTGKSRESGSYVRLPTTQ